MMTGDKLLHNLVKEVVDVIESAPDYMGASISLILRRTDNSRRETMIKNGTPLILFHANINININPEAPLGKDLHKWESFLSVQEDPEVAIREVLDKFKTYLTTI